MNQDTVVIFFTVQDDESSERDSGTGDSKRSYDNMEHVVDTVIHSFLAARGEGWSISPPPPSVSDLGTAHSRLNMLAIMELRFAFPSFLLGSYVFCIFGDALS